MKHLSLEKLAETVIAKRKAAGMSQTALSEKTGINRTMFTRLEAADYSPSVDQLLALSDVLGFDYTDLFVENEADVMTVPRKKVAVAGTGYVGLSLAVLLSRYVFKLAPILLYVVIGCEMKLYQYIVLVY